MVDKFGGRLATGIVVLTLVAGACGYDKTTSQSGTGYGNGNGNNGGGGDPGDDQYGSGSGCGNTNQVNFKEGQCKNNNNKRNGQS